MLQIRFKNGPRMMSFQRWQANDRKTSEIAYDLWNIVAKISDIGQTQIKEMWIEFRIGFKNGLKIRNDKEWQKIVNICY